MWWSPMSVRSTGEPLGPSRGAKRGVFNDWFHVMGRRVNIAMKAAALLPVRFGCLRVPKSSALLSDESRHIGLTQALTALTINL